MTHPFEDEPFRPPLRGCGCLMIALATGVTAGTLLLGGILGDCLDNSACHARKASAWIWLTPLFVLIAGAVIGAIFLRVTARRD